VRRLALACSLVLACLSACDDGPTAPQTEGAFGSRTEAYVGAGIPVIQIAVDDQPPQAFFIDTGSPVTLLVSGAYGHSPDYTAQETHDLAAFGLTVKATGTVVANVFPADVCGDYEVGGIIGGDLLHFYQLTLDYLGAAAFLWNGLDASPDIGQDVEPAVSVPVRVRGGGRARVVGVTVDLPPTRLVVDGTLEGYARTFLVDTGASLVTLSDDTFQTLANPDRPRIGDIQVETPYGVQNGFLTRLASVTLGDVTVESVPAFVHPDATLFHDLSEEVQEPVSLLVGGSLLREFQTTIRYDAGLLDLARYRNPVHLNANEFVSPGFDLATGCTGGFFVVRVYDGSSAAQQSLQPGTQLVTIDGQSLADLSIDDVLRLLHSYAPGESATFEFRRFVGTFTLTLTYADLLPPYAG
jgi:hypothetical protein